MADCGKYDKYIQICELQEGEENEIGEVTHEYVPVKELFARIEARIGSLLVGRQADTVVSKTTHKISYPLLNYPELSAKKHRIVWNNKIYSIDYILDDDELDEEMQAFVTRLD